MSNEHQIFQTTVEQDPQFEAFVKDVTPADQVQQVWLSEFFLILKILWELFQLMKSLGWFDRWLKVRAVRRAMRYHPNLREDKLKAIKDEILIKVNRH
jgi:hypothetical protein